MPQLKDDVPASWGTGFVRGRILGYERGNLALKAVSGAIKAALQRGTSPAELVALLSQHALAWDQNTGAVSDNRMVTDDNALPEPSAHPMQSLRGFLPPERIFFW
jgi:hypothetical protein